MSPALPRSRTSLLALFGLVVLASVVGLELRARADDPPPVAPMPPVAPTPPVAAAGAAPAADLLGKAFPSPDDAAKAFVAALAANDDAELLRLLGTAGKDLVADGRDPIVRNERKALVEAAARKLDLDRSKEAEGVVTANLGDEAWPLPLPLAKSDAGWRFDVARGRAEILARQVGRDELQAIALCRVYVDVQVAYASVDRDGDGVREYAQRLVSTPGSHDGLYWSGSTADDPSPSLVELTPMKLLDAATVATAVQAKAPFAGYYWRVLTAQGAHAPGGAYSYVINGNMIAGFALLAIPADYRVTGVKSFLVSHHGKVFEKDLGPSTRDVARAITEFDPDETWTEVTDEGQDDVAPETDAGPAPVGPTPPCAPKPPAR
jgi:hypothetical protein